MFMAPKWEVIFEKIESRGGYAQKSFQSIDIDIFHQCCGFLGAITIYLNKRFHKII